MAISKTHAKKSPSQNPVDFALMKQSSGKMASVPDKITSPAPREQIYGKKGLK